MFRFYSWFRFSHSFWKYARIQASLLTPRRPSISRPTISHLLSISMALFMFEQCSRMPHNVPPYTFALDAPFWKAATQRTIDWHPYDGLRSFIDNSYPPTLSFSLSCTLSFFLLLSFYFIISPSFALFNLSTPYYIAHWPVLYLLYIVAIPYAHLFWLLLLYCFRAM